MILRPENRQRLRNAGFVVWLTASPPVCWRRLQQDRSTKDRRPNLTSQGGLAEVEAVLAYREPLYRETAELIVPTEEASPEQIADRIYSAYQKYRIENP